MRSIEVKTLTNIPHFASKILSQWIFRINCINLFIFRQLHQISSHFPQFRKKPALVTRSYFKTLRKTIMKQAI